MDLILIAAAKFEVDPLLSSLQQKGYCPETHLTGVGAINAAKEAKTLSEVCRGKHAIFVGTCGVFVAFTKVKLVRVQKIKWIPTGERTGLSYPVKDCAPPILLPPSPPWCADLPAKHAICSPSISLIRTLPEGYDPTQYVENLELYSCAHEIATAAKSFAAILAITNEIGQDAHSEWKQNFAEAAGLTAEYISHKLPGLS